MKTWHLSYLNASGGYTKHTFLLVKDALDHVRLFEISKFKLRDVLSKGKVH